MMKKIQIAIAITKKCRLPDDGIYLPMQVGAEGKDPIGYLRDDTGENISGKNPMYCELTAMYWLWKNSDADYCGVLHYRRFLGNFGLARLRADKYKRVLDRRHLEKALEHHDIILPKRRRYYIESMYSHYSHSHYEKHLQATREVISRQCPEYMDVFRKVMDRSGGHMFNMLIMKREKFDAYCGWLFPILAELEEMVDTTGYSAYQRRYLGRVGELLLDVWIEYQGEEYKEVPMVMMGRVRWVRKMGAFLAAKMFGKRYTKSF